MNLYLFEMLIKFFRILFVAMISIFNISLYSETEEITQNNIINQRAFAINSINITGNIKKTNVASLDKGQKLPNKVVTTEAPKLVPVNKTIETFTGRLTGYGPDCAGCSSAGNVACKTREKTVFSLKNNGLYYTDKEFGKVRIIAAAISKFKCGTVINITKPGQTTFTAIVLDTGGSMRKAWSKGEVWMDLAYTTNAMAGSDNLTGKNIKFEVQRYGW